MNSTWENIADGLRAEIIGYGGLLNSFAEQQRLLFARDTHGVLRVSTEIEDQLRGLFDSRQHREQVVAAFAVAHQRPAGATLRSLLPLFDRAVQPLLEALINELNVLIHRVRRMNRHNHALLARAVSSHREILQALRPEAFTQTYAANGRVAAGLPAATLKSAG